MRAWPEATAVTSSTLAQPGGVSSIVVAGSRADSCSFSAAYASFAPDLLVAKPNCRAFSVDERGFAEHGFVMTRLLDCYQDGSRLAPALPRVCERVPPAAPTAVESPPHPLAHWSMRERPLPAGERLTGERLKRRGDPHGKL